MVADSVTTESAAGQNAPDAPLEDGKFVTSRQIRARLERELEHNVALRVQPGQTSDNCVTCSQGKAAAGTTLPASTRREEAGSNPVKWFPNTRIGRAGDQPGGSQCNARYRYPEPEDSWPAPCLDHNATERWTDYRP